MLLKKMEKNVEDTVLPPLHVVSLVIVAGKQPTLPATKSYCLKGHALEILASLHGSHPDAQPGAQTRSQLL